MANHGRALILITWAGGPGLANLTIESCGGVSEEAIQVVLVESGSG
jgi:hypothetical protein